MSTITELMERAASERQHNVGSRRDSRPSQRRSDEQQGAGRGVRMPARCEIRAKDGGTDLTGPLEFFGHATAFERGYEMWDWYGPYTEIVSDGAADVTLAQTAPPLDTTLNLGHDQLRRIASTVAPDRLLRLSVESYTHDDGSPASGLAVLADNLDPADYDVRYIAPKLSSGLITEMSFAFRITSGQWSPDYMEYRINAFDIHRGDVAIVGYGANPHTDGALRGNRTPATRDSDAVAARVRTLVALAQSR
jgi:hypothetical protein